MAGCHPTQEHDQFSFRVSLYNFPQKPSRTSQRTIFRVRLVWAESIVCEPSECQSEAELEIGCASPLRVMEVRGPGDTRTG